MPQESPAKVALRVRILNLEKEHDECLELTRQGVKTADRRNEIVLEIKTLTSVLMGLR